MTHQITFEARSGNVERNHCPVEVEVDWTDENRNSSALRLIEQDAGGATLDDAVPFQLDSDDGITAHLIFTLTGITAPQTARRFALVATDEPAPVAPQIRLQDEVMHEEQASYRVETPAATYLYHKLGAGFASLYDGDGHDWLSYRPFGGSNGKYRGIPNLAHPENYFHPGGEGCTSQIVRSGPLSIKIASESLDGEWACTWDIFTTQARQTVLKAAHPYWFLYEGTPGGVLDEEQGFCVRSDGVRLTLGERWEMPLPAPEWVCFGAANVSRVLMLVHHEADDHTDSYWPMENNMTVFGFGRNGLEKFMTETPSQFSVGFVESADEAALEKRLASILHPVSVAPVVP